MVPLGYESDALMAFHAQWGRRKGLTSQSVLGTSRGLMTAPGGGGMKSLHLDIWMPYISSQDNCCTTGKGVQMRSARTHIQYAI